MFHNVVNFKLVMNHPTLSARIATLHEDTLPLPLPAVPIVPASDEAVGALLFLDPGV
jgi:hypothetical protein